MTSLVTLLATILLVSTANILLRWGMAAMGPDRGVLALVLFALRTPAVCLGGLLYVISMVAWLATLRSLDLGLAYPVYMGGTFAAVLTSSVVILGERFSARRVIGVTVIVVGMVMVLHGPRLLG